MTPDEIYDTLTTIIRCMLNEDGCAASECDTCEYYLGDEFQMLPFMIQIRELVGQMRWIPVTESLPPEAGWYLVTAENDIGERRQMVTWFMPANNAMASPAVWGNYSKAGRWENLAWMKMPELWKGDENDTK